MYRLAEWSDSSVIPAHVITHMHIIHIHEGKRMRLIQIKEHGNFSDPEILSTGNFLDAIESWKIGENYLGSAEQTCQRAGQTRLRGPAVRPAAGIRC